mmetsp:Transcript_16644/g.49794  ORF Transcript_16644/g.49794 Transcript_16644/m.49794 type:complete len:583 (-) Transcript_16644:8-1756(-)
MLVIDFLEAEPTSCKMASAVDFKNEGNKAFAAKDYEKAIECFTKAIELDDSDHVFFSNRSAVYATTQQYQNALKDAEKVIELKADWPKGYLRKAAALHGLGRMEDAQETYEAGLKIDPNDAALKSGLQRLMEQGRRQGAQSMAALFADPVVIAELKADPKTAALMAQPGVDAMLADITANPDHLNNYMQNPILMQVLSAVLSKKMGVPMTAEAQDSSAPTPMDTSADDERKTAAEQRKAEEQEAAAAEEDDETRAKKQQKKEALAEKELGNAAYNKREFETALTHYTKAQELDSENIVYFLNRASVYMAQKKYEQAAKECDDAVARGREVFADFAMIAKAFHRKGRAQMRMRQFSEALESFDKSMMEKRTAECLKDQQLCERYKKKAEEEAYFDPALSDEAKKLGNEAFQKDDYPTAVKHFTEAIKRNPKSAPLYSNRAAAYTKLMAYPEAKKDCDSCIALDPNFIKGYTRKATVHVRLSEFHKAMAMYEKALTIDPENQEVKAGIHQVNQAIAMKRMQGGANEEERKRALADPEIQEILRDSKMNELMRAMEADPNAAQRMVNESADLRQKYQRLVQAGLM